MYAIRPPNFQYVVNLFGSLATLGRELGVGRSAVTRWANERAVPRDQQLKIIRLCVAKGESAQDIAYAIGVPRCECCGSILDKEIRQEVLRGA